MNWQQPIPKSYVQLAPEELVARIAARKEQLSEKLVILGHHYQQDDVIRFADVTGDSFQLSREAAKLTMAKYIIFCGVHFMAESADILAGDHQQVILPDLGAGCSMADMAQLDDVLDAWRAITEAHAGLTDFTLVPITYMNSSAAIKSFVGAHGGGVCTSSNCQKILRWALDGSGLRKVIFFPDQHLGRNTAFKMGHPLDSMLTWDYRQPAGGHSDEQILAATVYLWKGHCSVHQLFRPEHVDQARAKYPGIKVIVHPECRYEVVQKADLAGSTDFIGKTIAAAAPGTSWSVGTEVHMVNRLAKAHPDKLITILSECQCLCTTMYRIDPPHLLWVLDNLVEGKVVNEIIVDDHTKYWAKVALNRMLDITAGVPAREPEGTPPSLEPDPRHRCASSQARDPPLVCTDIFIILLSNAAATRAPCIDADMLGRNNTRRLASHFLTRVSHMATGVSTESFATSSKQQSTGKKLRVAIVGCGGISDLHLKTYKKYPDVEIVAGVDIKQDRLDWVRAEHGVTETFTDWKEMLKKIKPDAVDVCTPNGVHAPAVIDALNAGCHVETEKPMAMSPRECEKMIAASEKNKRKLAVGFQYRFHPNTTFLAKARDEGEFGKIMFVKCQALRRRGIPNWGVFGQKHLQGGGPMIDIGVHVIEMAHYVMGSPPYPIAASGNTWTYMGDKPSEVKSMWPGWDHKTYTVEDLAIGQIRFDNGAILQIEASFVAHIERDVWNFTLMGEKGGGTWDAGNKGDNVGPAVFTDRAGHMTNYSPTFTGDGSFGTLFDYKLRNFVDACLYNKALLAPGEAGLAVQKILDGVYRSAEAGKEVKID